MPKRDLERLFDQIRQMAARLTEGDEGKGSSQLASDLRQSGIDPDILRRRFYEAARAIAARERTAGRPAPLALQQAIEQTAPDEVMPSDSKTAEAKMSRWIDRFSAPFALPADLETARAFRKRGDVDENEQAELDELEQQLKDEIKKDHEGEG
jgi:hypothetical protein